MVERDRIPMCQQPTKRRMGKGVWMNGPGKCDNRGRYLYHGKLVCGKHENALRRAEDDTGKRT